MNIKIVGLIGILGIGLSGCTVTQRQLTASPITQYPTLSPSPALVSAPLPLRTLLTSRNTASYTYKDTYLNSPVTFSYPSDWTKTGIRTMTGEKDFTFQKADQKIVVNLECAHDPSTTGMSDHIISAITNWGADYGIGTTLVKQGKVGEYDFGSFLIQDQGNTRYANVVNVSDYVGDTVPGKCQLIILTDSEKEKAMADEILSTITTTLNTNQK